MSSSTGAHRLGIAVLCALLVGDVVFIVVAMKRHTASDAGALRARTAVTSQPASASGGGSSSASTVRALARAHLVVPSTAPGYSPTEFGVDLSAPVGRGCNAATAVLVGQLNSITRGGDCTVTSGTLRDPYTGSTVRFTAGGATPTVAIDHVVSLADAWNSGANRWSDSERARFAADPLNLVATRVTAETRKAGRDASGWLPPDKAYDCAYVARQVGVKAKYKLTMAFGESAVIKTVLATCPQQTLPMVEPP